MSTAGGRAYELIRRSILEERFAPGERLKEEELTAVCGVSRTPVREALKRLAVEGLVSVTPHQGAQVVALAPDELEETYALRAMIEGYAAQRAAARITPEALERLTRVQDRLEAETASRVALGPEGYAAAYLSLNTEFHQIIMEAAMSPRLAAMAGAVLEMPLRARTLARYSAEDIDRSARHHRELIAALAARDPDWAGSVMRSHVRAALQTLLRREASDGADNAPSTIETAAIAAE